MLHEQLSAALAERKTKVSKGERRYTVDGKKGVWRTSDAGNKLFIPDDGSSPLMNPHVKSGGGDDEEGGNQDAAKPGWMEKLKAMGRAVVKGAAKSIKGVRDLIKSPAERAKLKDKIKSALRREAIEACESGDAEAVLDEVAESVLAELEQGIAKMTLSKELQEAAGESAYDQLSRLFVAVEYPLRKLAHSFKVSADPESHTKSLAASSAELLKALVITAENKRLAASLKKHGRTIANFRKILGQYAEAKTWEQLSPILKSQMTRQDNAFSKFWTYKRHILSIVGGFTTTVESVIDVAGFRVMLMTAPQGSGIEWTADLVERLRSMLIETKRRLDRFDMGSVAYGSVFAYPTSKLPPAALRSHSALASYSPSRNTMDIAAGDEGDNLLHSMIHELGHRAYFRLIQGQGRVAWQAFFDAQQGDPDVDGILKRWESTASNPPSSMPERESKYLRYLGHYLNYLRKQGSESDRILLNLLADKLDLDEKFDPYTGSPKKGVTPGLDQLVAKKSQAKVFLHPVTAYSGTSAEELFAEVFAEFGVRGSAKVAPVLRAAFKMALPQFRESVEPMADRLASSIAG